MSKIKVIQASPYIWEIPKEGEMRVPGRIYGDKPIIDHLLRDVELGKEWNALKQIANVACLPGIQKASLAMSDVHPGYGFCIGGVGAFSLEEGVISVAGVGFDCNCGVRTLTTPLTRTDVEKEKEKLADILYKDTDNMSTACNPNAGLIFVCFQLSLGVNLEKLRMQRSLIKGERQFFNGYIRFW